jgi:hypothetical protein
MGKLIFSLAFVAGVSIALDASAAPLDYVATMNGHCTRLIFGGHDATPACDPIVTNSFHKDSRTGFTFTVGASAVGAVITFSGMGQQQVKDTANVVTQPLDTVIFTLIIGTGTLPPNEAKAAGICTYSNPYAGPSTVTCTAHTSDGVFEASFISDGKEPSILQF